MTSRHGYLSRDTGRRARGLTHFWPLEDGCFCLNHFPFTPLSTSASCSYCLREITIFYPSLYSFFSLFIHQYAYWNIYNKLYQLKITENVILCQLPMLLYPVGWIRGEGLRHAGPALSFFFLASVGLKLPHTPQQLCWIVLPCTQIPVSVSEN